MSLLKKSAQEIAEAVRTRQLSVREVCEAFLAQAKKWNDSLGAFIWLNEKIVEQAQEMDQRISAGHDPGPLAGVPVAIKDNICTKDIPTTAASKMLENFISPFSATLVERLEASGALILGKTNLDEFAMGSSNENSAFGICRNPWNLNRVPGGSSGGSAVAVAAGMSPLSIGTDTGGSIRQPASYCGIVGVKPSYGRVSRYGLIAFASSLDQAGPMGRSVADVALALEIMGGVDPWDATSAQVSVPKFCENIDTNMKGLKLGLPREFFQTELDGEIRTAIERALALLKSAGAQLVEIQMKTTELAVPTYYLIASSEASTNLSRYDGVRYGYRSDFSGNPARDLEEFYSRSRGEGFGEEAKRRIILGTHALSTGHYDEFFNKASRVRRLIRDEYIQAFQKCDLILGPVTSTLPFKIGEKINDPLSMYLNDVYTTSANLVGIPGMSLPVGLSKEGLPMGIQLLAPHFEEQRLFNVGGFLESTLAEKERYPDVFR